MQGDALQVAKQAAMELGLPPPTSLVTSAEKTSIQLLGLLNSAGYTLMTMFDWQFLTKTHQIATVAGQAAYPAPADFGRMINQTLWDHDNRRPAHGPVSPQGWQVLTNAVVTAGPFARYRVAGGLTEFLPVPGETGHNFNYQYISNGWVQSYQDPAIFTPFITNDGDTLAFDFWLLVKFLKLLMWQAKGLETTHLATAFAQAYDALTGQDHGAPILSLSNRQQMPWLTIFNVPDGNWNVGVP
jgi:hypothetical protein